MKLDLKDIINNFDTAHTTERIILIGKYGAIRQIILDEEETTENSI